MEESKSTENSEPERVINVFKTLAKDAENTKLSNNSQPVITMSSIGKFGRFGNQLFQYAFLRICAEKSGARVECPPWIGQTLFGHKDAPISKRLPPAIECQDTQETLFDIIPEFIPYLEKLADAKSSRVSSEALDRGLANVDIWGFFQLQTRLLAPHKEYFRSLFQPVKELKLPLEDGLNELRSKGKTVIGIHIRRGDYITEPQLGFTLVVPAKWYCQWLDGIWDKIENPVLFLCSDEIDSILPEFDKFAPVTAKDLDVKLPESMKGLKIEFYIDFFMLSNCDIVVTSNSVFSFAACMLNDRGKMFVRPHWDFSSKFAVFDPWDSKPLLWLGRDRPKLLKNLTDILYVTYITQGFWVTLKTIFFYVPNSHLKWWIRRLYLGYQIEGFVGVINSLLYTLGWRSVWKRP